jgi:hypothetical protein
MDDQPDREVLWLALSLIRELKIRGFESRLLTLACSEGLESGLRTRAALALEAVATDDVKREVADRLSVSASDGFADDVKAVLLRMTWPGATSAQTFFRLFTAPSDDVIGLYDIFPAKDILTSLKLTDLPAALQWVSRETVRGYLPPNRRRLADGIVRMSADNLGRPRIHNALAQLLIAVASHDNGIRSDVLSPLSDDVAGTQSIISAAVSKAADPEAVVRFAAWQLRPSLGSVRWLVQRFEAARGRERDAWLWLLQRISITAKSDLEYLRRAAAASSELKPIADAQHVVTLPPARVSRESKRKVASPIRRISSNSNTQLKAALDAADVHAKVDVVDLVRGRGTDGEPLWDSLTGPVRKRVDEFLRREVGLSPRSEE